MKVILLQDITGVGKKEQILEVSDGYAVNFLFPKKLAVEANKSAVTQLENKRKSETQKKLTEMEASKELKSRLEALTINLDVKKGEKGRLFGSVTNKEIAQALEEQHGIVVDKKKIVIPETIKTDGDHNAEAKLYTDITAKLNVHIN